MDTGHAPDNTMKLSDLPFDGASMPLLTSC